MAGLVGLATPTLLFLWLIVVSVLGGGSGREGGETAVNTPTPWGAVILALLIFIPLHEMLHAVWHPHWGMSSKTIFVIWPRKLRFGVYYDGCMTRRRWLLMRLAPLFILSILPVMLLSLFFTITVSFALETFLQVLLLVNGIGSGGDIVAAIWILNKVPSNAEICFHNGKAYWTQR